LLLQFFSAHAHLADAKAFAAFLAPLRNKCWFVYAKRPFALAGAKLATRPWINVPGKVSMWIGTG
jgi:hypothetical protein